MRRKSDKAKTVTIYNEKYYARENQVMPNVALAVAQDADVIYAVEQGEIEIPSYGKQRRMVCVLRFERIIRPEPESSAAPREDTPRRQGDKAEECIGIHHFHDNGKRTCRCGYLSTSAAPREDQ